jgi:serine/threonine-protein kinase
MNLTAGAILQNGKYTLNDVLGQSDLGITLKATQAYLHQSVILKTLKPNPKVSVDFAQLKQRFVEEARRFAQCQHPGLVRLVDLFEESGVPFAVMDYVAGESLSELVQPRRAMSEAQAVQYIRQIGSALTALHRNGLIHRDVKPKNLIRPSGADFVVLVDYGISSRSALGVTEPSVASSKMSYAPIEQYQPSTKLTAAADIYSLAATLYFLVTGHQPTAANLRERSSLPSPRKLQPNLSQTIEAAILSGMQMNAQNRPQTIAAWFSLLPGGELLPPVKLSNGSETSSGAVQLVQGRGSSNGHRQTASAPQTSASQTSATTQATRAIRPNVQASANSSSTNPSSTNPSSTTHPTVSTPIVQPSPYKSRLPKAIAVTATIATACGLGLGLTLRLSAVTGIGPKIFNTQQTFPPLKDWPGTAEPVTPSTTPLPEVSPLPVISPPPKLKASPQPTLPSPEPKPQSGIEASPSPSPDASIAPSPAPEPVPQINLPPQLTPVQPSPTPSEAPPAIKSQGGA